LSKFAEEVEEKKMTPSIQRFLWSASTLALLCAVALVTISVRAQTDEQPRHPIIIEPPHLIPPIWPPRPIPSPILNQELQLISQSANVEINGATAKTKLTQIFQNTTGRRIEGTYVFPLPEGAAVSGFAMTVNGKRMEAEILEGDKAREIYTSIVSKLRDPAILEFIDRNLIKAKVFPIEPGAQQTMELEYSEALRPEANAFRYVVPLRLPLGGNAQQANVDIKISSPDGIKAVYSPTHDVEIKRDENTARVTGEWGKVSPRPIPMNSRDDRSTPRATSGSDRDFVLYYTTAKSKGGVNLITHKEAGEDGYFMMLVAPDPQIAAQEIAAKDVVFVFDTSGSMQGEKIEQSRKALLNLISNLNPNDRFNIVTFSSDTRTFRDGLTQADKSTLAAARDWIGNIKAVGGTNINDALIESLKLFQDRNVPAGRARQLVFMTDGQPTVGETDIAQILKNVRSWTGLRFVNGIYSDGMLPPTPPRLFVFGVGYDVNTRLLDTLAADNRGSSDYVLPNEDIEQRVGSLYNKIAFPVLSNPRIDWNGMKVFDVYPKQLPDLFKGTQTVVFGRYEGRSTLRPQLIGLMNNREERIAGQGDFAGEGKLNDVVPRLWATRKVGYLLDEARLQNRTVDAEVKDEIIKLSKKFGIVTPFTAGLITEDEKVQQGVRTHFGIGADFDGSVSNAPAGSAPSFRAAESGANAVMASKARRDMRDAQTIESTLPQTQNIKTLEGKTVVLKNGVWTDAEYDAAKSPKVETIKFASQEYFALLKDARMAKWLSVGEQVLIVLNGRVVKIEP
jgi:Ca-activated chloride channel family protein